MPFPLLLSIFYAEFDAHQGPKVLYEVPEGFVKKQPETDMESQDRLVELMLDFDSLSEYVLPKPELCNRLVQIDTDAYHIIGHPVLIEHDKYPRNALLYNFCFVFERSSSTTCYQQVVRKVAREFKSLETEIGFLFNQKHLLMNILNQLYDDLNTYNESQIVVDEANSINLKVFPDYSDPPVVYDHQVPVIVSPLNVDKHWDLTLQRMIPYINGINSIKRISYLADIDTALVRLGVRHLLYYGCIKVVDIFQYSNIYAVAPFINWWINSGLYEECRSFICTSESLSMGEIFHLYSSFKGDLILSDWISKHASFVETIDIRRFIVYGVMRGLIRRLHRYPILPNPPDTSSGITSMLDGQHCLDEILTKFGMSFNEVMSVLSSLKAYIVLK